LRRARALAELRAGLRNRLERSILMDGAGFTRQLEELYRQMWRARAPATG
jgi:predicted O-linked N-acetylglucosamine transferase (SPINDLY family)